MEFHLKEFLLLLAIIPISLIGPIKWALDIIIIENKSMITLRLANIEIFDIWWNQWNFSINAGLRQIISEIVLNSIRKHYDLLEFNYTNASFILIKRKDSDIEKVFFKWIVL